MYFHELVFIWSTSLQSLHNPQYNTVKMAIPIPFVVFSPGRSLPPPLLFTSANSFGNLLLRRKGGLLHQRTLARAMESSRPFRDQGFYILKKDVEDVGKHVEMMSSAWLEQEEATMTDLEHRTSENNLWDDLDKAEETLLTLTDAAENIAFLKAIQFKAEDAKLITQLAEMKEVNSWLLDEAIKIVVDLNKSLHRYELSKLLSGPYDKEGACLTISAGKGGTDDQEWADMLKGMYLRWAEKQGLKTRVVENSFGKEGGINSATIEFECRYAYGYLSGEKGIHQISRHPPSISNSFEKTNIAGVDVVPLFVDNYVDMEIPEEDLEISCLSMSGDCSQSFGKAQTAVHIVHVLTGISVHCAGERSQFANKIKALNRLKAKLLVVAMEQKVSRIEEIRGDIVKDDLRQHIRNYKFYPKMLVQDVGTGIEISDVMSVMDGDFEPLIKAYRMFKHKKNVTSRINQ